MKVVARKTVIGNTSFGTVERSQMPVKDQIYTVTGDRFDSMGVHAYLLAELPYRFGFSSSLFRPLTLDDFEYEEIEEILNHSLTIVEPDTTKIHVAQKDGFSVGGAG